MERLKPSSIKFLRKDINLIVPNLKEECKRAVAIDFDGVIHKYSKGWLDGSVYDEPVDGAKDAIDMLKDNCNYKIIIYSARLNKSNIDEKACQYYEIQKFLIKNSIYFDEICVGSKPIADFYIDDNAIRFENWVQTLRDVAKIKMLKTSNLDQVHKDLAKGKDSIPADETLWRKVLNIAKQKFDVYPSSYASAWAVKKYKSMGGKYKNASQVSQKRRQKQKATMVNNDKSIKQKVKSYEKEL